MEVLSIMANKRMFSLSVVDTDWFLDLPLSTQALYFHLNMRADDDGFVDAPNSIVRKIGASKNDFDLLVAKRYVIQFESGIIVIKHWRMHNTIRKDRLVPTQFQEEYKQLYLKENGSYTDKRQPDGNQMATKRQPDGRQLPSLDLDLDLDIDLDNNNLAQKSIDLNTDFEQFWSAYPRKIGKDRCIKWFKAHKPNKELVEKMIKTIKAFKKSKEWADIQYIPYPYTWLNRGGWDDEIPADAKVDDNLEELLKIGREYPRDERYEVLRWKCNDEDILHKVMQILDNEEICFEEA